MDSETKRLLPDKDKPVNGNSKGLLWKYIILCIGTFIFLIGGETSAYAQNEWVQHKIQTDKFPDLDKTKTNVSTCVETNKSDPVYKNHTKVQQEAAHWNLYFNFGNSVPMLIMNMILNTYTDTYGRKFLILLSLSGVCFRYCAVCAVIYFNQSLWYIFGAYIVDGALGSYYGFFAGSFAYIADISHDDHNRVLGIACWEVLLMTSAVVSSFSSGYFIETLQFGFSKTTIVCTSLALIGFLMFIFIVPESLPKSKRTPPKPLIGTLKQMFQFYVSPDFKGKRTGYILLILSFFMAEISSGNRSSLETLYFLALPFCWDPSLIGIFLAARHAAQGMVGMLFLRAMQLCLSNEAIAILGTLSNAGSFVVEGLATTDIMIYMVPVVGMISFLMIPIIRGIMSVITDPDKQGALFGSISSMEVLSKIISSTLSNEIYAETYSFMHGFVFIYLAGICVINCILLVAYYVYKKVKLDSKSLPHQVPPSIVN